jgi:hypothetical protein
MANRIFPTIAPFIRSIFGQDGNGDFRVARVDYNGGLLAGPFGAYDSIWNENPSATYPAGGTCTLDSSAVPSGYLYIAQVVTGLNYDTTAHVCSLNKVVSGNGHTLVKNLSVPSGGAITLTQTLVLAPGEFMRFRAESLLAGATLYLFICGYKVRLT